MAAWERAGGLGVLSLVHQAVPSSSKVSALGAVGVRPPNTTLTRRFSSYAIAWPQRGAGGVPVVVGWLHMPADRAHRSPSGLQVPPVMHGRPPKASVRSCAASCARAESRRTEGPEPGTPDHDRPPRYGLNIKLLSPWPKAIITLVAELT